jgi:hypothetical protein
MFEEIADMPEDYYLAYPSAKAELPEVQALRAWVLDIFREYRGPAIPEQVDS